MKNIDHVNMPREKLSAKGPENLKDHELLAIMLRTGSKDKDVLDLSRDILRKYPLNDLVHLSENDLQKIKGVGKTKAAVIIAAFELAKRVLNKELGLLPVIKKPLDSLPLISYLQKRKKEYFVALFLNSRNQVMHYEEISIGTLTASLVHPREIFQPAIEKSSSAVILAHNHPSGDATPSKEDIDITKRLKKAGEILGIEVLDHLIITHNNLVSMREKGYV